MLGPGQTLRGRGRGGRYSLKSQAAFPEGDVLRSLR